MSKSSAPPDHLLEIVDPLGEIRRHAKELYEKAGSPVEKSWKDFWPESEAALTVGPSIKRDGEKAGVSRLAAQENALQKLAENSSDPFLLVIARHFPHGITSHQARCLAIYLSENSVWFHAESVSRKPIPMSESASLLALACLDYSDDELKAMGVHSIKDVPQASAESFWREQLRVLEKSDRALDFQHRNTILRLHEAFSTDEEVREVAFSG